MKKFVISCLFFSLLLNGLVAQQNVQYSQFVLNDYGLNPAVAGSSKGIFFMAGRRIQWSGFDLSPESNFASFQKDFGKKGFRLYWHGVGAQVEQDRFGVFDVKTASVSYAIHIKLNAKLNLSAGLAAGIKQVGLSTTAYASGDPALQTHGPSVLLPDIIPGIYLYSRKLMAGIAVRNLYGQQMKQGSKEIGTDSRLRPNAYISLGRKFVSPGYDFIYVPAIHIQTTFTDIPVISVNCMAFYRKRVGLGISYRMHDALTAMLQVRVFKNVVVGFAYDYTISRIASKYANATEIMIGLSPVMSSENYDRPTGAAECPKFEF